MIVHGTLFGFNARSGKLLWEHEVEQGGLDLSHPADVPILALGSRSYEQDRDGDNVVTRYTTRLEVLDKRSGKVLHQETLPGAVTRLQVTPDSRSGWATVNTTRSSLRFVFREPLEATVKQGIVYPAGLSRQSLAGMVCSRSGAHRDDLSTGAPTSSLIRCT